MTAQPFPPLSLPATEEAEYLLLVPVTTRRPRRLAWIGGALAMLASLAAAPFLYRLRPAPVGEAALVDVRTQLPQELVEATQSTRVMEVESGEAQAINASLPFSSAPIEAARPFGLVAGTAADHRRALDCLTQAVYYEAGFEPIEGRRAVAQVVLNRVRHPAFPQSVCGVVYEGASRPGCQFSFTCDGSLRRPPSSSAWAAAAQVAREALAGTVTPTVGLATHYHANYVVPYWAPRLAKLSEIGAHIFYRWPGGWGRSAAFSERYSGIEPAIQAPAMETGAPTVDGLAAAPRDLTDRRAPEDVGGRLDVTKGWTLSIPLPSETRSELAETMRSQAAPAATAEPADEPRTGL